MWNRRHPKLGRLNSLKRVKQGLEDRVRGENAIHLSAQEIHGIKEKHAKVCGEIKRLQRECEERGLINEED